jgi:phage shock protein E
MIGILKKFFGYGPEVDYRTLLDRGAIIVDVRTKGEYKSGHIRGSLNMPLESLDNNISKLKKEDCIITCCASGMRSAAAARILKANGCKEVYNGGGWRSLQNKMG